MFFSWGSQGQRRTFFSAGEYPCPSCAKDQTGDVVLNYTVRHVWYLFRWVTDKRYDVVCATCNTHAGKLNTKTFEAKLKKPPIPFIDRLGWAVGLGAVAVIVAGAGVAETANKKNDLVYLNGPQVGDVYEMDFGSSGDPSCADCKYGTALVSQVDAKGAYVHFSKRIYNKISGAGTFATSAEGHDPSQYLDEVYLIPREKLIEMRQKGTMLDVYR